LVDMDGAGLIRFDGYGVSDVQADWFFV
jgi:hypothetical protein